MGGYDNVENPIIEKCRNPQMHKKELYKNSIKCQNEGK
jgi:hypothetical protein